MIEWYEGLSNRFLTARCARMLVLAGQERLDKELMVGQMCIITATIVKKLIPSLGKGSISSRSCRMLDTTYTRYVNSGLLVTIKP